jgi:hypothetical protein
MSEDGRPCTRRALSLAVEALRQRMERGPLVKGSHDDKPKPATRIQRLQGPGTTAAHPVDPKAATLARKAWREDASRKQSDYYERKK